MKKFFGISFLLALAQLFALCASGLAHTDFSSIGGDFSPLTHSLYSRTVLNQYSSRTVLNKIDVIGVANPAATVTVNSSPGVNRKGAYFRKELSVSNNSYPAISVTAVNGASSTTLSPGKVFIPPATETFYCDLDGNLTEDGRWDYTYDGENQLIAMQTVSTAPIGSERRVEFEYDSFGRRIRKKSSLPGSATISSEVKYLYDGWNLLAELNGSDNSLIRSYVWGLDIAGAKQGGPDIGAGGVGALLAVNDVAQGSHFVAADGFGNISALIKASNGTVGANYEYDPFGQLIRKTGGAIADANPFRFSTKYTDSETDLVYYGLR